MIKVAVFGAKGRMGTAVCQAVEEAEDTELVAAVDSGGDRSDASGADVIVDFTTPDAVMDNLSWAISHDINTVVGTTGFDDERYQVLRDQLADHPNIGCLVAPNFSIGAVLMMHFAEQAAKFYESLVTGVLTCALPIYQDRGSASRGRFGRGPGRNEESAQRSPWSCR